MEAEKRERGCNFTEQDKEVLINIVTISNIFCVLESKRTDAVNVKRKNETWKLVAEQFNAISTNEPRFAMQLKSAYNNYNRKLEKDKADDKVTIYKSGGGPPVLVKESESQAILSSLLKGQIEPLCNKFDSSNNYFIQDNNDEISNDVIDITIQPVPEEEPSGLNTLHQTTVDAEPLIIDIVADVLEARR
ncbi:hypothetical protein FQA39_LY13344 [Lamprigera yunnana]|nr:hypothetical protein FQA39_LY13344 [Lamprigera yunnana]